MRWTVMKIRINAGPGAPILYEVVGKVSFGRAPVESDVLRVVRPLFKRGAYLHVAQLGDDWWRVSANGHTMQVELTTRDIGGQNVWSFELHACLHRYRRRLRRLRGLEAQLARALLVQLLRRMSPWRSTVDVRQMLNHAVYGLASALHAQDEAVRRSMLRRTLPWLQKVAAEVEEVWV